MNILQIGKFFPPYTFGGIETHSYNLHHLFQGKDDITFDFLGFLPISYKEDIKVDEHIYLCKTNIDKFSTQFSWSFIKKWREVRNNYDIIYVNLPHPFFNLVLDMFPTKAKIVLMWHSDIIKQKKLLKLYSPFLKKMIAKSTIVSAPTNIHLEQSDFTKYFSNTAISPLVTNYETEKHTYKLTDNGKKVIFSCGRLVSYKGFKYLIDAAKLIDESAVIHIGGAGPLKEELEKLIKDNKLDDKVKLLGRLSDEELNNEYKNCYLYCFPSITRAEMMGYVQFEALSYCKPIVSTNISRSGAPTINIEGVTGFKVDVENSEQLSEKINLLLKDEKLYENMCNNAEIESKKNNDKSKLFETYYRIFTSI